MDVNTVYKVEPLNNRGNTKRKCGLLLKGNSVNVRIYGLKSKPQSVSDLVDLTNNDPFIAEGAYLLTMLPTYIYFTGTADVIELINYTIVATSPFEGDLPMSATDLTDMGYSSAAIDERLIYLATLGLTDITIYLFGNEQRTSASDAAVEILEAAGCYIESDYTP